MRVRTKDNRKCESESESEPEPAIVSSRTVVRDLGPQFHKFNQLPPELRRMIWKLCLPNRVVELNRVRWLAYDTQCHCGWTTRQNSLPPPIAHVNSEAREVAMEVAVNEEMIEPRQIIERSWPFWFQRKRDIVMMYRDDSDLHYGWNGYPFAKDERRWLAGMALDTAVFHEMIEPWNHSRLRLDPGLHYAPGNGWVDPLIILESIRIHARKQEVLAAEVFGKLADESIQLVDPFDGEQIGRYYQLYLGLTTSRPQSPNARRFFESYATHPGRLELLQAHVRAWIEQGETREVQYLWERWKVARDHNFRGVEDPAMIWEGPAGANTLDEEILTLGSIDGGINLSVFRPNETHPWVQDNLVKCSFRPRIMFRWCADSCWDFSWCPRDARQ